MKIPARKTSLTLALLLGTAACSSPDLSGQITQVSKMLDDTVKTTGPALKKAAQDERKDLLRQAAYSNTNAVKLPKGCRTTLEADLSQSVAHCHIQYRIDPVDRSDSPIRVSQALTAMQTYFAVLKEISTSNSPDQIRANSASLLSALAAAANEGNFAPLTSLNSLVAPHSAVLSATAGFLADQVRIKTLRRTMTKADPLLKTLASNSHNLFTQLGDTVAADRIAVADAMDAYIQAISKKDADAQIKAVETLQKAVTKMHAQEKVSPIRRLHLTYEIHNAMLKRLKGGPSLTELHALTSQVAEIVSLLEE